MTVYVDELRVYPERHGKWCHMMCDGEVSELHEMAERLELRPWFQRHPTHPHYDLVESKRQKAIEMGAVEVTSVEMVRLCSLEPAVKRPTIAVFCSLLGSGRLCPKCKEKSQRTGKIEFGCGGRFEDAVSKTPAILPPSWVRKLEE